MNNETVRVLLVDDHSLFRKGVRSVLEASPGIRVVGEAGNGAEGIRLADECQPDVILMDINMPIISGLEATRQIKARNPEVHIIILTVSETDEDLYQAVRSGAQGYLQKRIQASTLAAMIRRVVQGEALLSGLMAAKILKEFRSGAASSPISQPNSLTSREVEVLNLVGEGCTNREIAQRLMISENTVKHHLSNVLDKLHLRNRTELALHSRRQSPGKT